MPLEISERQHVLAADPVTYVGEYPIPPYFPTELLSFERIRTVLQKNAQEELWVKTIYPQIYPSVLEEYSLSPTPSLKGKTPECRFAVSTTIPLEIAWVQNCTGVTIASPRISEGKHLIITAHITPHPNQRPFTGTFDDFDLQELRQVAANFVSTLQILYPFRDAPVNICINSGYWGNIPFHGILQQAIIDGFLIEPQIEKHMHVRTDPADGVTRRIQIRP